MEKITPEFKKCSTCNEQKSSGDFYKRAKSLDGLYGQCKICMKNRKRNGEIKRKLKVDYVGNVE